MTERTLRGRPSIFRKTDRAVPELERAPPSGQPDAGTATRRIKATFYLEPDDVVAIDVMQTEEFKRTGRKPERSQLVSRAIQQLFAARRP